VNELLVGLLVAAVGAAVSTLIAYPLGQAQGKQQTIFEEQAKVMMELRTLVMETDEALFFAGRSPTKRIPKTSLATR